MRFVILFLLLAQLARCSKIKSDSAKEVLDAIMSPEAKINELEFKLRTPIEGFMGVEGLPTAAAHLAYLLSLQKKAEATDLYFKVVNDKILLEELKNNYYWNVAARLFLQSLNVPQSALPELLENPYDLPPLNAEQVKIQATPFMEMTLPEVQRELSITETPQSCETINPLSNCMTYLHLKWQEAILLASTAPGRALTAIEDSVMPFKEGSVKFKIDPRIRYILFGLRLGDEDQKRIGIILNKLNSFSVQRSKVKFTLLRTAAVKANLEAEALRIAGEKAKLAVQAQEEVETKEETEEEVAAKRAEGFATLVSQLKDIRNNYQGALASLRIIYKEYQEFPTQEIRMDHLAYLLQRFPEKAAEDLKEEMWTAFIGNLLNLWHREDMVPMFRALVRVISDNVLNFLVDKVVLSDSIPADPVVQNPDDQLKPIVFLKKHILVEVIELLKEDEIDEKYLNLLAIFFRLAAPEKDSLITGFGYIERFVDQSDLESTGTSKSDTGKKMDKLLNYFQKLADKVPSESPREAKSFSITFMNVIKARCHPCDNQVKAAVRQLFLLSTGEVPAVDIKLLESYLAPGRFSTVVAKDPSEIRNLIEGSKFLKDDLKKLWETFIDQTFIAIEDINVGETLPLKEYCEICNYGENRCLRSFKALNDGGKDSADISRMAYCFLLNSKTSDPNRFSELFEFSTLGLEEFKEALHLVIRTFGTGSSEMIALVKQSLSFDDRAVSLMEHLNNSIEPLDNWNPDLSLYRAIVAALKSLSREDLVKPEAYSWLGSTALIIPELYISADNHHDLRAEKRQLINVLNQVEKADADYIQATYRFVLSAISYIKETEEYEVLGPLSQTLLEWAFSNGDMDLIHQLIIKCSPYLLNEYLVNYLKSPLTVVQIFEFIPVWSHKKFMFSRKVSEWNSLAEAIAKNPNYQLLFKVLREQTGAFWPEVNYESTDLPDEIKAILPLKQNLLYFEKPFPQATFDYRFVLLEQFISYIKKCHIAEVARIEAVNRQYEDMKQKSKEQNSVEASAPETQTPFYVMIMHLLEREDASGFDKINGIFWAALAHFPQQPLQYRLYAATRALKCHVRLISNSNIGLLIQKHRAKPIRSNDSLIEEILAITKIDAKFIPMTEPDVEMSLPEDRPTTFPENDQAVTDVLKSIAKDMEEHAKSDEGLAESIEHRHLPKVKATLVYQQQLLRCNELSIETLMKVFDEDEKSKGQITTQCIEELSEDVRGQFLIDPSRLLALKTIITASIMKSIKPELLRKVPSDQKTLILNDLMLSHSLAKKKDHPCAGISPALLAAFNDLPEYQDIFITSGFVSAKPFQSLPEDDPRAAAVIVSIALAQEKSFKREDFESIPAPLALTAALALHSRPDIKHPFSIRRPASPPNYDLDDIDLTPNLAKSLSKLAERLQKQISTDYKPRPFKEDEIKRNMAAVVLSKRANWATSPPEFTEDSDEELFTQ